MLQQIEIHNVALIDNLNIEFGKGLNILTGETGAGKSIIIDSINAILGERVSKDLIRSGEEKAAIEAVFQLHDGKLDEILKNIGINPEEDDTVIISREFTVSGKNTCRVNGKLVPLSTLKEIGARVIDIHGQHDNQSLLKTENHIELLDSFASEEMQHLRQSYEMLFSEYKAKKLKLKELTANKEEREKKAELFRYQIDEIRKAKLKPGEEEELNKKRLLLINAEKIFNFLASAYESITSGNAAKRSALDSIYSATSELKSISRLDHQFANLLERLENIYYQLEDVAYEIRKKQEEIEFDPHLLEQVDERLDTINRLKRKYGNTIDGIQQYCLKIEKELNEIDKSEEDVESLTKETSRIYEELYLLAQKLNSKRVETARILEDKIAKELDDLELKSTRFKVDIQFCNDVGGDGEIKFMKHGLDKVEFLISPNEGEPLRPLARIASGGEMSRIMLALKTILANVDRIPTLIFDELDIGVSGKVSQRIGEKLSYISRTHQVICVTHHAQIACMADSHYLIEKISRDRRTITQVRKLENDFIRNEIARILGGAVISDITLRHAEEMIQNALKFKKK